MRVGATRCRKKHAHGVTCLSCPQHEPEEARVMSDHDLEERWVEQNSPRFLEVLTQSRKGHFGRGRR